MPLKRPVILGTFPNLMPDGGVERSPQTPQCDYNCIAFAADEQDRVWWPGDPDCYWPLSDGDVTLKNFENAFRSLGYRVCSHALLEPGFEKIAFYVAGGNPTHAAKQLPDGRWKSKLGVDWEDVEHNTLRGVESALYGKAVRFMKKPTKQE